MPATRDPACNPGMCPDWDSNWQPYCSQAGAQSTKPHQPGRNKSNLKKKKKMERAWREQTCMAQGHFYLGLLAVALRDKWKQEGLSAQRYLWGNKTPILPNRFLLWDKTLSQTLKNHSKSEHACHQTVRATSGVSSPPRLLIAVMQNWCNTAVAGELEIRK